MAAGEQNLTWEDLYEKYNGNYDWIIAASLRSRKGVRKGIMQEVGVKP